MDNQPEKLYVADSDQRGEPPFARACGGARPSPPDRKTVSEGRREKEAPAKKRQRAASRRQRPFGDKSAGATQHIALQKPPCLKIVDEKFHLGVDGIRMVEQDF